MPNKFIDAMGKTEDRKASEPQNWCRSDKTFRTTLLEDTSHASRLRETGRRDSGANIERRKEIEQY